MKALLVALVALVAVGAAGAEPPAGIYRDAGSSAAGAPPGLAAEGYALFGANCASCHSVAARAPSLRGVGARAADFYLRTGYMPLESPDEQPWRRRVLFTEHELRALVAYVASLGGPPIPKPHPERGSTSEGMRLFTENCAGCHQVVARGGMMPGARIPSLADATAVQIAEAVRIGPYLMPRFSRQRLSDGELDSVIRYVREGAQSPKDAGGWGIGHLGPIPEGLVAWLLAGSVLLAVTLVIGRRARP